MLEGSEAPVGLKLIDDVADTDRPEEHGLAFGAADRLSWRAAWPQVVVCHCNLSFSGFNASTAARFLLYAYDTDAPSLSARVDCPARHNVPGRFPTSAGPPIGLVAPGHEAAVDVENRTGDPAGLVGEQIGDGGGDVGRGADSSQWVKRRESVKRGVDLVLRDPPLESGVLTAAGATALTRI